MRRDARRRDAAKIVIVFVWLAGCTSPPAVTPLLRVVEAALQDEAGRIEAEAQRDARHAQQTRRMLARAYRADLHGRDTLDAQWVEEATSVYVLARESVLRHELASRDERRRRAANLRTAAAAQQRAVRLLERQDELIAGTVGLDLWQLFKPQPEPRP